MSYGIIYKVTNLINGKIYIGQTSESLDERKRKHLYHCNANNDTNTIFYNSIRKHGENNFSWEIIDGANTKEELDERESFWINYLKTYIRYDDSNGYNMTLGGDGCEGYKHSDDTKLKMSKISKERFKDENNHPMYGRNHTDETKKKLSIVRTESYSGENHPMYGREHTEESKRKMSESKIGKRAGKDNYQSKTIIQLTLDGEFVEKHDTIRASAKAVNGSHSAISKCCSGERGKHKGFKWMYEDDYLLLKE